MKQREHQDTPQYRICLLYNTMGDERLSQAGKTRRFRDAPGVVWRVAEDEQNRGAAGTRPVEKSG